MKFYRDKIYANINYNVIFSNKLNSIFQNIKNNVYFYKKNISRLDKISQQYYQTPFFGWLILIANPQFGGLETNIYDGAMLKIPYPLETSLLDYKTEVETHFFYYGK